jgi:type II secretory pathway component PulC
MGIVATTDVSRDENCNGMELVRILWVKPSSQGAVIGLRRGDLIYQIGESRITIHDDIVTVLSEETSCACFNNTTLKVLIVRRPE